MKEEYLELSELDCLSADGSLLNQVVLLVTLEVQIPDF